MFYLINNKPFVKVGRYYIEVTPIKNEKNEYVFRPTKNRLTFAQVDDYDMISLNALRIKTAREMQKKAKQKQKSNEEIAK